jgi:hypothetical protein
MLTEKYDVPVTPWADPINREWFKIAFNKLICHVVAAIPFLQRARPPTEGGL